MAREDFQDFAAERHPGESLRTVARRSVRSRRDPAGIYARLASDYGFDPSAGRESSRSRFVYDPDMDLFRPASSMREMIEREIDKYLGK